MVEIRREWDVISFALLFEDCSDVAVAPCYDAERRSCVFIVTLATASGVNVTSIAATITATAATATTTIVAVTVTAAAVIATTHSTSNISN